MDSRSLLNFHDDDGYEMGLSNESVNSEEERYHMVERAAVWTAEFTWLPRSGMER